LQRALYIIAILVALLMILSGFFFYWFSLPESLLVKESSRVERVYQILCLIVSLSIIIFYFLDKTSWRARVSKLLTYFLLFLFLFPFLLQTFSPNSVSRAAWLNSQHQNLSWLGGDIYTTQEYASYSFKNKLFVVDSPRDIGVFAFPYWNSETFSLGVISELVNWLGYSNHFCQFAKKGFFLSILGSLLLLILCLRRGSSIDFRLGSKLLKANSKLALLSVGFVAALVLASGFFVSLAQQRAMRGEYQESRDMLLLAGRFLPVLASNSSFVYQLGLLDTKLGINSEYGQVFNAKSRLESGKELQALDVIEPLIDSGSAAGREARRLLTRIAIEKVNSDKLTQAETHISRVLKREPSAIKANYVAQLISLRRENLGSLAALLRVQREVYSYFNTRGKKTVLASGYENEALLNLKLEKLEAADSAWKSKGGGK